MNHNLVVTKTVEVNATLAKVWDVLTNPAIIKEYLFGTETITDWKVGSPIIFQGEYQEQTYRDKGVILANVPNETISYCYWSAFTGLEDAPENYSTVTYRLKKKSDTVTEFTWEQKGYATEEAYQHSQTGMDEFMHSIKAIMER